MKKSKPILILVLCMAGVFVSAPCFPGGPPRPLELDYDNDNLCNVCEKLIFGTNPDASDTDGDGKSDGDEDHDLDGITNLVEMNYLVTLNDAIFQGDKQTVVELLDYVSYMPVINLYGRTALMSAARSGQTEIVQVLLQAGADVNHRDSRGYTALRWAAERGNEEIVRLLLDADADSSWG